ncbi:MAG: hypothetical protein IPM94_13610 [bacterium]|nr:hypothetical protein [bacterium]
MHPVLPALLLSATAGLVFTPWLVGLLRRASVMDVPNERSSHARPVPVGGGIGILVPWLLGMGVAAVAGVFPAPGFPAALVVGAIVLAVLGFVDDLRGLPPLQRLAVESVVAAACLKAGGLPVVTIALPGLDPVAAGAFGWVVAWVFVVGFTNMFNFMDGIDGLAGFQALLGAGALAVWAALAGDTTLAVSAALLAGATVGFLRANYPRARVFMGDVGSLPLGFLLAMGVLRVHAGADRDGRHAPVAAPAVHLALPERRDLHAAQPRRPRAQSVPPAPQPRLPAAGGRGAEPRARHAALRGGHGRLHRGRLRLPGEPRPRPVRVLGNRHSDAGAVRRDRQQSAGRHDAALRRPLN